MELALIVRAFHQDYVESAAEARALPSALRLNRTTDEVCHLLIDALSTACSNMETCFYHVDHV